MQQTECVLQAPKALGRVLPLGGGKIAAAPDEMPSSRHSRSAYAKNVPPAHFLHAAASEKTLLSPQAWNLAIGQIMRRSGLHLLKKMLTFFEACRLVRHAGERPGPSGPGALSFHGVAEWGGAHTMGCGPFCPRSQGEERCHETLFRLFPGGRGGTGQGKGLLLPAPLSAALPAPLPLLPRTHGAHRATGLSRSQGPHRTCGGHRYDRPHRSHRPFRVCGPHRAHGRHRACGSCRGSHRSHRSYRAHRGYWSHRGRRTHRPHRAPGHSRARRNHRGNRSYRAYRNGRHCGGGHRHHRRPRHGRPGK